jgi:hypothetical protein
MNRKQHFRTHVQGESLEGKIQELSDKMYEYLFLPAIALAACIYIWMIFLGFLKVELFTAVFMSALLLVVSIRAFFKIKNLCKTIRNHQKGLDGERFVGSIIEKTSSKSTFVFHDIVCEKKNHGKTIPFNIDHVIISTKGIFAIDAKNWNLHDREYNEADFIYDNEELIDSTGVLQKDVMQKIDSQAKFLEDKIYEWTGKQYQAFRVGIMIGAFVKNVQRDFKKWWIINDGAFLRLFEKESEKIPLNDVIRISDSLRRFVEKPIK